MSLLKKQPKKGLPEYTYLGCPLTANRSPWCFRFCKPTKEGKGRCGRIAPHTLKGSTVRAIEAHNLKKRLSTHFARLENMYRTAACNRGLKVKVKISDGSAEILIPVNPSSFNAAGNVDTSFLFKILEDAGNCAVNSVVLQYAMEAVHFNIYLSRPVNQGELYARAHFMIKSGDSYIVESVLTDLKGMEIARGSGTFRKSRARLSAKRGYC
jgi:acyl-coenzyme A thioesterase PaaI-like protein